MLQNSASFASESASPVTGLDVSDALLRFFGARVYDTLFRFNKYVVSPGKLLIICPNSDIMRDIRNYHTDSIYRAVDPLFSESSFRVCFQCDESIVIPRSFTPSFVTSDRQPSVSADTVSPNCGQELCTDSVCGEFVSKGNVIFSNFEPKRMAKHPMVFSTFITDKSNELAFLVAQGFAGIGDYMPASDSGILFLRGDVGFGKTHLSRAIQHGSQDLGVSSVYFSAESFTSAFVNAVKAKTVHELKSSVISADVLIVDDIHSLAGRKVTVSELSRIICHMIDNGKRVVLTSTQDSNLLDPALRSRVLSGMKVNIGQPSRQLREQILWQIVGNNRIPIGSREVCFLAENVVGGIRELKGAINRISVASTLNDDALTIHSIREVIPDLLPESSEPFLPKMSNSTHHVQRAVCGFFGFSKPLLVSSNKTRRVVYARNLGMYICRNDFQMPYQEIAALFCRNSHNAVIAGVKSIESVIRNIETASDLESVRRIISRSKLQY